MSNIQTLINQIRHCLNEQDKRELLTGLLAEIGVESQRVVKLMESESIDAIVDRLHDTHRLWEDLSVEDKQYYHDKVQNFIRVKLIS